jgi:hypothetical protein
MDYRYYRYRLAETLSTEHISRAVSQAGAVIVRIDSRDRMTEVTVAAAGDLKLPADSPLREGVEVSEQDVRRSGA